MKSYRLLLLIALIALFALAVWFIPPGTLSLSAIQQQQAAFNHALNAHPWRNAGLFFLFYTLVAALSIPGAAVLTLLAGSQFDLLTGTVIISFASTLGATLAMLCSRYLLRDFVDRRYQARMALVHQGMAREGAWYLFALRLIPLFPFFLVNLLMGLTRIPVGRYWWVSQLGMLPATVIFLNAGRQLASLNSLAGILSPGMILAMLLLGLLPLVSRRCMARFFHY